MKAFRFGLAAIAFLVLTPAVPASGAAESTASCVGQWHVSFSPGLGSMVQETSFTTSGGTVNCVGAVNGHEVTGPGTFSQEGALEGTCLQGSGSGTNLVMIPTAAGLEKLSFPVTMTYGPGMGLKFSDSLVGPYVFSFYPVEGDCATTPVTEIAAVAEFILRS